MLCWCCDILVENGLNRIVEKMNEGGDVLEFHNIKLENSNLRDEIEEQKDG